MGRKKKYKTEEERMAAIKARKKKYYEATREKEKERKKKYYADNKKDLIEYQAKYRLTLIGRAKSILRDYCRADKESNRGDCTLTADWIVEHIFTQPCHYCGETDWHLLGCDRLDNTKPHTPDNVVPCCLECNLKRNSKTYDEFMRLIKKVG